jgi:hypothetical protein
MRPIRDGRRTRAGTGRAESAHAEGVAVVLDIHVLEIGAVRSRAGRMSRFPDETFMLRESTNDINLSNANRAILYHLG